MKKLFTFLLLLVATLSESGEIREIQKLEEVHQYISSPLSNREWILFDIDYTLIESSNPVLQMNTFKVYKDRLHQEKQKLSEVQTDHLAPIVVTAAPNQLTEKDAALMVQKLIHQGATVIGFTALETSEYPDVGELPVWRDAELERLGINFVFMADSRIDFNEFPPYRGTYPLFSKGVLYANSTISKGDTLAAFLKQVEEKPERILLVDDLLENHQTVQEELDKLGISFLGLHYNPPVDSSKQVTDEAWKSTWDSILERLSRVR